ncbi:MAG: heme-binding domain-containing protein [Candidatus Eisenbacteria bacterium]|uniref:Heme-binding domain-containing protein n=1 Tax=Eiseniibacteriota bacterium TaxID=2212470 RepID=A0A956M1T4_UNCEI|nr:heme-binding domain-containing protein [Candidatus Eisenbacteria bacterium]
MTRQRLTGSIVGALAVALLAIQLVPYGRQHTNPPVTGVPQWDSPRTEELARRACFDCHSHETRWPWYASIAPVSWRVQSHVDEGREHLDFSAFDRVQRHADDAAEMVTEGEMPPWDYAMMHPEARLSDTEKQELIRGLTATFGSRAGGGHEHGDHDDD